MLHAFRCALAALVLVGTAVLAPSAAAQIENSQNRAAFYRLTDPDEVAIAVSVWGDVRYSGYFEVPRGTTLSELLSIAGGPANNRRTRRQRITTRVALNRVRPQSTETMDEVYVTEATNAVPALDQDLVLQDGDILSVDTVTRTTLSWRDVVPVVGAVGTVVLVVDRLIR